MSKIDLDINKLDWLALARVLTPILAPVVLATAWIIFSKFDKKADLLSKFFAVTEVIPTVNLNLPSGIVLGSFYNTSIDILESGFTEDLKGAWGLVKDFVKKEGIYEEEPDVVEDIVSKAWGWLTGLDIPKKKRPPFGGKGLA